MLLTHNDDGLKHFWKSLTAVSKFEYKLRAIRDKFLHNLPKN